MNNDFYEIDIENLCVQDSVIYVKPETYAMSVRKLEGLKRIAMLQKYYQCNPVRFIGDFLELNYLTIRHGLYREVGHVLIPLLLQREVRVRVRL